MEGLGLQGLVLIAVGCLLVGLGFGYLISRLLGGSKDKAAAEQAEAHEAYRDEVREHFEQTSQIMSRMVDDYREMYKHMSEGAGKLANIHPEKVITPPPAPEAITDETSDETATDAAGANATAEDAPAQSSGRERAAEPRVSQQPQTEQPAAEPASAKSTPTETGDEAQPATAEADHAAAGTASSAAAEPEAAQETDKQRARRLSSEGARQKPPHQHAKSGGI